MALKLWTPLKGNLNNYGLSNVTITNNNATIDNNGKIGQCYVIGLNKYLQGDLLMNSPEWSISCWVNSSGNSYDGTVYVISLHSSNSSTDFYGGILLNKSILFICRVAGTTYTFGNITTNTWHHLCVTYKNNTTYGYVDGVFLKSFSTVSPNSTSNKIMIGKRYGKTIYYFDGKINDVRVYDHALSEYEVKEISKALVVHYKLDSSLEATTKINLVANGWGGTENWLTKSNISTDVPSSQSGITNSYINNLTIDFISIYPERSYTLSAYMKKNSESTNSTCYFTLIPYDIDKNRISFLLQKNAFKANTLTTLSQDLKPGDNVVYLTDLSEWQNPTTYLYYIAIFGYSDSTGYTYPDLVYTRRVYSFGSSTDKSNLDIANNRITLKTPYSGEIIPAGTSACLTGDGATYYYPLSTPASSVTDWKLLSTTFIPQNTPYLLAARYIKVMSLNIYQYLAGITLTDNGLGNIVYDSSGYQNNGMIVGNLTVVNDSERYNKSTYLNSTEVNETKPTDPVYIIKDLSLNDIKALTIAFWLKKQTYNRGGIFELIVGGNNSGNYYKSLIENHDKAIYSNSKDGTKSTMKTLIAASNIPTDWVYLAFSYNGDIINTYLNGNLYSTFTIGEASDITGFLLGLTKAGGAVRSILAYYSDFRMYATALSAEDILDLYHTSASIDDNNNLHTFEIEESKQLTRNIIESYLQDVYLKKNQNDVIVIRLLTNCQISIIDNKFRIYRNPNISGTLNNNSETGTKNFGAIVIRNTNNILNFQDGHKYILTMNVKGVSNDALVILLTNNHGWTSSGSKLIPNETTNKFVRVNPVLSNYNSSNLDTVSFYFEINDGLYKTCQESYSTFVSGLQYISFRDIGIGFSYTETKNIGTDIYISNIRLYDVTNISDIKRLNKVDKSGITEAISFVEENKASINTYDGMMFNNIYEK